MSTRSGSEDFFAGLIALGGCLLPSIVLLFGVALLPLALVAWILKTAFGH